jgi:hypothetical protein
MISAINLLHGTSWEKESVAGQCLKQVNNSARQYDRDKKFITFTQTR